MGWPGKRGPRPFDVEVRPRPKRIMSKAGPSTAPGECVHCAEFTNVGGDGYCRPCKAKIVSANRKAVRRRYRRVIEP